MDKNIKRGIGKKTSKKSKKNEYIKKAVKGLNAEKAKEYYILSEIFDKAKGLKKRWW
jgi:hypothetical protein